VSGRRRRGLLGSVLRGGAVGRRIRVKAILLSSSRGDLNEFGDWVKFESFIGFIPVGLAALALYLKAPVPLHLVSALMAGAVAWACFVFYHAYAMAFRMNRRHEAYMRAIGIDLSVGATLGDPKLWRRVGTKVTMREALAEIKAAQAPD